VQESFISAMGQVEEVRLKIVLVVSTGLSPDKIFYLAETDIKDVRSITTLIQQRHPEM
jgi:hypothetical protein